MLEINESEFRKKLLKYYYKLKINFENESNEKQKIEIIRGICTINEILENKLEIYDDEYGFDCFYKNRQDYFYKISKQEYKIIFEKLKLLKQNKNFYNSVFSSSKKIFESLNDLKVDLSKSTKVPYKQFYDLLFNIPLNELNCYISKSLKGKKLFVTSEDWFENQDCPGVHYNLSPLNKDYYYIDSKNKYSYLTAIMLVHEISHSYVEHKYNCSTTLDVYREVMSFFHEFVLMDYFISNNIIHLDVITNYTCVLNIVKGVLKEPNNLNDYEDYLNFMYLLGPLVAYSFYETYKTDKEKCNYYLDYFHKNLIKYEPLELLKKSNIEIEQLTSGEISKRMIKQYDVYNENYNQRTKI